MTHRLPGKTRSERIHVTLSDALVQRLGKENRSLPFRIRNALAQSKLLGPLEFEGIQVNRTHFQRKVIRCSLSLATWLRSESERTETTMSVIVESHCWRYLITLYRAHHAWDNWDEVEVQSEVAAGRKDIPQ